MFRKRRRDQGKTALQAAAVSSQAEVVEKLLERGADRNRRMFDRQGPL